MKNLILFLLCFLPFYQAIADIKLPRLISNGMVLQRDQEVRIWGWASPSEKITVQLEGKTYQTVTDAKGTWNIRIPAHKAGGPYNMSIKGNNEIKVSDILFGEVWVCSGQSNMELWMDRLKYKYPEEIRGAFNPSIRQFLVPDQYNFEKSKEDLESGNWVSVSQQSIGEFSAVGYFFAKEIFEKYKVPVGLINAALGGSPAEAWISEESLQKFPTYLRELKEAQDDDWIRQTENKNRQITESWMKEASQQDEGIRMQWKNEFLNDADWSTMSIPGYWSENTTEKNNGVMWFRKEIQVSEQMTGKPLKLELGRIVDADSVFINGKFIGWTSYQYPPRRYELPAHTFHAGRNMITVKIINQSGQGGWVPDKRYELTSLTDTITLSGIWKYKRGATLEPMAPQTNVRWRPAGLYNSMIAPLHNYTIRGVLWYQGESNVGRWQDYYSLMETLIREWRSKWKQGDFPFLFVQLASFLKSYEDPRESSWAALRQQQLKTLSVPNTGMAVTIDIGEWNDVHPENKKEVGYRLSLLARKMTYGEKSLLASGPLLTKTEIDHHRIILHFTNAGKGLKTSDGKALKQIAIAGDDKKYYWANIEMHGNRITVWSEQVSKPKFVRYAWADNPEGATLCNSSGLPASPFTTEKP